MIEISSNFWGTGGMGWLLLETLGPFVAITVIFQIIAQFAQEKTVRYFLRKNRIEFFTLIAAVLGYLVSYMFVKSPGVSFLLSIGVTFVATLVLIYTKTNDKSFYFISLQSNAYKNDWIGEGVFQYDRVHDAYAITDSASGFIFSRCLTWSDYSFNFDFKILNQCVGAILRATNLSNLVMLQITDKGIRPHIRINGFWQAWEANETHLAFHKTLNLDKWYRARLQCDQSSIRIRIYGMDDTLVLDRVWKIPSGHITYMPPKESGLITQAAVSSIPFPINLEYGTAGFRNNSEEKAVVRSVLIEKLQGTEDGE